MDTVREERGEAMLSMTGAGSCTAGARLEPSKHPATAPRNHTPQSQTRRTVRRCKHGRGDELLPGKLPADVCRGDPRNAPLRRVHVREEREEGRSASRTRRTDSSHFSRRQSVK